MESQGLEHSLNLRHSLDIGYLHQAVELTVKGMYHRSRLDQAPRDWGNEGSSSTENASGDCTLQ